MTSGARGSAHRLERRRDVRGRGGFGQQHAVGHLSGDGERLRAAHAEHDGRNAIRCLADDDALDLDVAPGPRARLTPQQRAQGDGVLAEQGERAGGPCTGIPHPVGHAVADAGDETAGEELSERCELHRREGDVASARGHDPDTDDDALGGGQHRTGLGHSSAEAEVLDDPQLVESELLGATGVRQHTGGGEVARDHHADAPAGRVESGHGDVVSAGGPDPGRRAPSGLGSDDGLRRSQAGVARGRGRRGRRRRGGRPRTRAGCHGMGAADGGDPCRGFARRRRGADRVPRRRRPGRERARRGPRAVRDPRRQRRRLRRPGAPRRPRTTTTCAWRSTA